GKYRNEGPLPDRMLEGLYATEKLFDPLEEEKTYSLCKRKLLQKIGRSLMQDQVIEDRKRYSFVLNARTKKLVVNGQHYPNLQAKYERIVREAATFKMSPDFIYEFEYRGALQPHVELSNYFPNPHRTYSPMADAYQTYLFDNFVLARALNKQLKKDDLINEKTFKLEIDDKELMVNGKLQSHQLQEKYESLFRTAANVELSTSFQVAVEQYNDGVSSFIIKAI
ncbi:MAG: hypothetical protein AAFO82_20110, partial [Bacteroidota bacterium]